MEHQTSFTISQDDNSLSAKGCHCAGTFERIKTSVPFAWTAVLVILFTSRLLHAQFCTSNAYTGCTRAGAVCGPVTTGTGDKGICTNPPNGRKGELTCECAAAPPPTPPPFDIVTYPAPPAGMDASIRIDRPNPQQPSEEYVGITFQPGDTVTIHAGGCVQSGGSGNTWHQYVTPTQNDSLYYGLITIPFATAPLERIEKYRNQSVHIADTAPSDKLHLQLGFLDKAGAYGDNGYYSHDNGPGNQCAGPEGGPAWVQLDVKHHGIPPPIAQLPWDLVISQYDDNGIPLNPDWASNVISKHFPDPSNCRWPWQGGSATNCTSTGQIVNTDYDSAAGYSFWKPWQIGECRSCRLCQTFSSNYGYGGHANWMTATQTGKVSWEERSGSVLGNDYLLDDEYSVNIATPIAPGAPHALGATAGRPEGVHVEFDASETIDILTDDMKIPWWQQFRSAVAGGDDQAHQFLDNSDMIVTGLMAVDFAHVSTGPESHPAWAMAVHSNTDFSDDTWAFLSAVSGTKAFAPNSNTTFRIWTMNIPFDFRGPRGRLLRR